VIVYIISLLFSVYRFLLSVQKSSTCFPRRLSKKLAELLEYITTLQSKLLDFRYV